VVLVEVVVHQLQAGTHLLVLLERLIKVLQVEILLVHQVTTPLVAAVVLAVLV
jgi:hypothetical protein